MPIPVFPHKSRIGRRDLTHTKQCCISFHFVRDGQSLLIRLLRNHTFLTDRKIHCTCSSTYMATHGNGDDTAPLISGRQNEVSHSAVPPRPGVHFTGRGQKLLVTICILVTELCERLTFYVVTANLVLFCSSELKLDSPWPSVTNYLFQGSLIFFGIWVKLWFVLVILFYKQKWITPYFAKMVCTKSVIENSIEIKLLHFKSSLKFTERD